MEDTFITCIQYISYVTVPYFCPGPPSRGPVRGHAHALMLSRSRAPPGTLICAIMVPAVAPAPLATTQAGAVPWRVGCKHGWGGGGTHAATHRTGTEGTERPPRAAAAAAHARLGGTQWRQRGSVHGWGRGSSISSGSSGRSGRAAYVGSAGAEAQTVAVAMAAAVAKTVSAGWLRGWRRRRRRWREGCLRRRRRRHHSCNSRRAAGAREHVSTEHAHGHMVWSGFGRAHLLSSRPETMSMARPATG